MAETTDLATIDAPDDLKIKVSSVVQCAREFKIVTAADYEAADKFCTDCDATIEMGHHLFDDPVEQAFKLHKSLCAKRGLVVNPPTEAKKIIRDTMTGWRQAERIKAEEAQRKINAEIQAKADTERRALEAKAEKAKKPETKEKYAEAAANVQTPTVYIPPTIPKITKTFRKHYFAVVVDPALVPDEYWDLNQSRLDKYAALMKEMAKVPGVRFECKEV